MNWTLNAALASFMIGIIGCNSLGGASNSVRVKKVGETEVVVTDADVRMGYTHPIRYDEKTRRVKADRIFCAEPSPDVAKAVQSAFGFATALEGTHPSGIRGALKSSLSSSEAEALAQLGERMATIQLLRDGLYRACEAYANGAMSEVTYAVLLSRYDDTMITLLFGELAAGNFGRSLAALGGSSKTSSEVNTTLPGQVEDQIDKASKALAELKIKRQDLEKARAAGETDKLPSLESAVINAKRKLEEEVADLSETELASRSRADTMTKPAGRLNRQPSADVGQLLKDMLRSYLYDVNTDALAVACIVAMATEVQNEQTALGQWCSGDQGAASQMLKVQNKILEEKIHQSREVKQDMALSDNYPNR